MKNLRKQVLTLILQKSEDMVLCPHYKKHIKRGIV